MQGIWSIRVTLSGSSFNDSATVAQIVFQFIFLGGVLFGWYRLPEKAKSIHNGFQSLRYATYFLIAWYFLTILDLFLHEGRLYAAYGYILLYFFITVTKFAADILVLTGTLRVLSCLISQRLDRPLLWIKIGEFQIIILLITALYHLGSYFANEVLWLNVADPDVINDVSSKKDRFEAAFFIIQWLLTLAMLIAIAAVLYMNPEDDDTISPPGRFAIAASAVLWIRCFSEFVIVIRYHLQQYPATTGTVAARYFVYGLCTSGFLVLIAFVAADPSCQERRDQVRQLVEEDIRLHIKNRVDDTFEHSRIPPVLSDVFRDIKQDLSSPLSDETKQRLAEENKTTEGQGWVTEYVKKLEKRYGNLRPTDRSREH